MTKQQEYANALRAIADFVEANPELHVPNTTLSCYSMDEREDAARVLAALRPCNKRYTSDLFKIEREFGPITLEYVFFRHKVCTKRVVGTKVIPAKSIPAQEIPERIEEIVEWDCSEPLLPQAVAQAA
jgi:acyl carrier protein phosphodiesterase